jgi:ABC-type bacteriocin/lantibiotic exporter with double-glycine peptidase domain
VRPAIWERLLRTWYGGRAVRVPTRLQYQTTECGVAALAMVLAHFGRFVALEEIRRVAGVSRDCMNGADLARAARHFGLECKAYRREPEALRDMPLPLVAHVRFIHFTVIEGFNDTHVLTNDPNKGRSEIPLETFHEIFTGVVFSLSPSPGFRGAGADVRPLGGLWRRTAAAPRLLASAAMLAGLLLAIPAMVFAGAFGELVDAVNAGRAVPAALFATLAAAIVLRIALESARAAGFSRLQQTLALAQAQAMARHLLALPYAFFAYRLPARLHATLYAGDGAARHVCETLLPAAARVPEALLLLLAAAYYDAAAAAALFALALAFGAALAGFARWRSGPGREQRAYADDELGALAASLENLEPVKLARHDRDFVVGGAGVNARQHGALQRYAAGERASHAAWRGLQFCALAAALVLGAAAASAGRLTQGDWVALVLLAGVLGLCLRDLASVRGRLDALAHELLPIEDVREYAPARAERADGEARTHGAGGGLRMRDVVFGHAQAKPPLIDAASLEVRAGEQLGLTGPSGGGKSTIAGLLAGIHRPWSGTIECGSTQRVAWIDKTAFFFEGTVRENLCLWETCFDEAALAEAVRDACLSEVLEARPGGLDAPVEAQGRNFSGGQQQRLEIARALLRQPAFLVLDEATDALDPALEARVRERLRRRGCALVVVSHRASTLAACDRVVHVANGRIVDAPAPASAPSSEPIPATAPEPGGGEARDDALAQAFRLVAAALGERVSVPAQLAGNGAEGRLEALAAHNGLYLRRVRFVVRESWRRDHGPLIAFARDDARPLAVLPRGHRYRVVDPSGERNAPAGSPSAEILAEEAFALYPRVQLDDAQPAHLLASGFSRARPDLSRALWLSLALGLAWTLLPASAALLGAGGTAVPAQAALALAFAAVALVLIEAARGIALLRFEGRMELSLMVSLYQRLARILPAFTRRVAPEHLACSLVGVPRWLERVRGAAPRQVLDGAIAAAGAALLVAIDVRLGLWTLGLLAPALAAPPLAALLGLDLERTYYRERVVARRFLIDALRGFARLRRLGRAGDALRVWLEGYGREKRIERRIRAWNGLRAGFEDACPWIAFAGLAALLASAPPRPVVSLAAVIALWIAVPAALGVGAALAAWVRGLPFVGHVGELTAAPLDPAGVPPPSEPAPIEAREVAYRYPGTAQPVLRGVSLRVEPGELIAIAGPSGSGKSTLARLLLGFERADAGTICYGGVALEALDLFGWRRRVAAVLQHDRLGLASTLRSQVAGTAPLRVQDVWQAARLAAIDAEIRAMPMGIQTIVEGNLVSTGQEQRLLIARALARQPEILLLDEATNAVPEAMQARLLANLRRLGITCILVTHRESALALCDRVYVLEAGRVAWTGPPSGLAAQQRLLELMRAERMENRE